tara:strand:- start:437 stop:1348 length:912 start_codon:yes stop_codon:yes gene_type:complete
MKKFILKTLIFILIITSFKILLITLVLGNLPEIGYGFFLGENNKKNKIVIVGSSNVRYNFDYDLLNMKLNNHSVIGVTANAPSGLYVLWYKLKKLNLTKNDIVVFALPYSLYSEDKFLPITSRNKFLSLNLIKSSFNEFKKETSINLLNIKLSNIKNALKTRELEKRYTIYENKFFGYTKKIDSLYLNCYSNEDDKFFINDNRSVFNSKAILKFNDILNKKNNPEFFFRFPVLMENQFELNKYKILFLEKNLNFINSVESAIFERNYFYDQWYHLNFCGAQQNSLNLIEEITPFIENKNLTKP